MSINDQETPGFDPVGDARDRAFAAIPDIQEILNQGIPKQGQRVVVTDGPSAGLFGIVFWVGLKRDFRPVAFRKRQSWAMSDHIHSVHSMRCGVEVADGARVFIDATNVQVIGR